jgi:hypothetical protein
MKSIIIICMLTFSAADFDNSINFSIKNDSSLIAPGLGAENILLNQNADDIRSLKGYPDKISELNEKNELFKDVLKINAPVKIIFDKIYYYNFRKAIFFLKDNTVCAIAGLNAQRVTIDSVDLNKGAEYFVFSYGNKNLLVIKKDSDSKDFIYFYNNGIAVVDDKGDDKIDMYIVFPAEEKPN